MFGLHPVEMGMAGQQAEMVRRVSEDELYRELFAKAFPEESDPVSVDTIIRAIAAFERTLVSVRSPYDRYRYGAEPKAISEAAKRGEALFFSARLGCAACHSGPHFTDAAGDGGASAGAFPYHNTGLYNLDGAGGYPASNTGLISVTANPADMGRFRTPTLRNIAMTAPYMHDGSIATLDEVVQFYAAGGRLIPQGALNAGDGRANPLKDPRLSGFSISPAEQADLVAFLEALTDRQFLDDPRHANPWKNTPNAAKDTAPY
jgi:cytochrome c peroxidase